MPQNIYDDPAFFAEYSQLQRSREGLSGAGEWPALRAMLPPLNGARILDLGCGFGWFCRWARKQGAAEVLGIDLSEKMLAKARSLTDDSRIAYRRADIQELELPGAAFDLIYSSLAFHYIEDFAAVCQAVRRLLAQGGHLVFSVEHPIFTAPANNPDWLIAPSGAPVWPLDSYLLEGRRVTSWLAPGVIKQHRTISTYVNSLAQAGFCLVHLEEWGPTPEQIIAHPDWAIELHRPPFLLIAARASGLAEAAE